MYSLIIMLVACLTFGACASEGIVMTYDGEKITKFDENVYHRIQKALPDMPKDLCKIMASYVELAWSEGAHMEDSSFMPNGYLCVTYLDQNRIAAGTSGRSIYVWDIAKTPAQKVKKLKKHWNSVASIVYEPTLQCLASGSYDGSARLWPQCLSETSHKLKAGGTITALLFLGSKNILTGGINSNLQMWDIETKKAISTLEKMEFCHLAKIDDKIIIATGRDCVKLYDKADGKSFSTIKPNFLHATQAAVIGNGTSTFAVSSSVSPLQVFDIRNTTRPIVQLRQTGPVRSLAMSGKKLAALCLHRNAIQLLPILDIITSKRAEKDSCDQGILLPSHNGIALAANAEGDSLTAVFTGGPGCMQTWNRDIIK